MALQKTLLLDFDGVLYSNKFAHKVIAERSTRYCNKFVKSHNASFLDNFHRHLYKTHGHTVLGLQKIGYDASITDYNNEVFSNLNFMGMENEFDNTKTINDLIYCLSSCNIDTYLFSNAPNSWTVPLLKQMNVKISEDNVLQLPHLKPTKELYDTIEYIFGNNQLIFVDDNMINFSPIFQNKKWKKVLFADTSHDLRNDLVVIQDLDSIKGLI